MSAFPGLPHPLGATWDGSGVNFALYSASATAVELCLFDGEGAEERHALTQRTGHVWHGYFPRVRPGQRYGYRVHGSYDANAGLRFNPNVVLLDPYARAVDGVERWDAGCFGYAVGHPDADLAPEPRDQLGAPRAVVVDGDFDWEGDVLPATPLHRSVLYEAHVRGLTKLHPDVPEALRGTYAGIAHPAVVRHLRDLGITAIELMPVHGFVDDKFLLDRGLRNYWGYSSISYFAPDVRYRSSPVAGSEVREFKSMVKALHRAGIEVILDVVYNHTAEGNHLGPTFSFKGIDNPTYYRLVEGQPRYYFDYTGTGNSLNVRHPQVLALLMDSLRYWASEMHVDGFRFDLASALARQLHDVDRFSSFFTAIHQSPDLANVKLIAEPWDFFEGGYQVGNFPVRWAEWNDRYRQAVRNLWRGGAGGLAEVRERIAGSRDLYHGTGRRPSASVDLITAHDGFTLRDLVSYEVRHNEANGEDNRDGPSDERSFNCGVEGPTDDPGINAVRARQVRNLLATLFLSQGTPMLLAGDEMGRTQRGNNNAYCQDNDISWVHWDPDPFGRAVLEFARRMLRLRREHPALTRTKFFRDGSTGTDATDVAWLRADGVPFTEHDWHDGTMHSFAMLLGGRGIDDVDEQGRPLVDDDLIVLFNAWEGPVAFQLPTNAAGESWHLLIDTANDVTEERVAPGGRSTAEAHALKVFRAAARVLRRGGAVHTFCSTYRLQLEGGRGFGHAEGVIAYLAELGVTDVYTSPIFAAAAESTHGYDVTDHNVLNPRLGTDDEFARLCDHLSECGMGFLVDWVPNHMGIATSSNTWWYDLLENGPGSQYADTFDIDWAPGKDDLRNRVLLPILGDSYGDTLERGELKIALREGAFTLRYFDQCLPLEPKSTAIILERVAGALGAAQPEAREEIESIVAAIRNLPERTEVDEARRHERERETSVARRRLERLAAASEAVQTAVSVALAEINGKVGSPESFDTLDTILRDQNYRVASWRVATEEINYRRFFDVNDLAAIRMENDAVFDRAHRTVFELIDRKRVQGLRLDHTDGLYDPLRYFEQIQRRFPTPADDAQYGPDDRARPLPLFIEKILGHGERLESSWPVDGTTGYEVGASIRELWVDPTAETAFTEIYRRATGDSRSFREHVYQAKCDVLRFSLASEVAMLSRRLLRIAGTQRRWRDFTLDGLTRALTETITAFRVYRTYLRAGEPLTAQDERCVREALTSARLNTPSVHASLFDFLGDLLLCRTDGRDRDEHVRFALRFQQFTGPVMAKAVEDTAFYRYTRLACLNEVGGDPTRFGTTLEAFHKTHIERMRTWPLSMSCLSTHDTKRGEDTAARIATLTEMPDEWRTAVGRWSALSRALRQAGDRWPSPVLEYLFYQSAVGAIPFGWDGTADSNDIAARLGAYLLKAAKEAKVETSWSHPDESYDRGVEQFVARMMGSRVFVDDLRSFCAKLDPLAATNGLAQTVLRLSVPGVSDTYQGSELWTQTLVDPDNRRPVDFARRAALLRDLRERLHDRAALCGDLLARFTDGAVKLYVVHTMLEARRADRELFLRGDYTPLSAGEHAVAFERSFGDRRAIVCVPRLSRARIHGASPWPLGASWGNATVPIPQSRRYRDLFTGAVHELAGSARIADVLARFPVAVLQSERASS